MQIENNTNALTTQDMKVKGLRLLKRNLSDINPAIGGAKAYPIGNITVTIRVEDISNPPLS